MGQKTKIDWCDSTWSPVTGCLHGCEYCYARKIANRFGGGRYYTVTVNGKKLPSGDDDEIPQISSGEIHVLDYPLSDCVNHSISPYPFYFDPTLHRYRLNEPQKWKKPRNIFVCSMADLFGDFVPDEWISEVFKACEASPQHRYMFLTKNPSRYDDVVHRNDSDFMMRNAWFGASATTNGQLENVYNSAAEWVSIEPIHEEIKRDYFVRWEHLSEDCTDYSPRFAWVVIGAETGNQKSKVVPKKEWIIEIADACRDSGTPIFMKESLRDLMGDDFRQEFPWEV